MNLLHQIPESTMVAVFLRAELKSERFANDLKSVMQKLGVPEKIVAEPNLQDEHENQLRAQVLGDYRGYKQNREIFTDFPDNLTWYKAELKREEIGNLQYVDYSYWNELTDHTHLVKDAVKNIQKGKVVFDVPHDRFLAVAEKIKQGECDFEPMILWGKDEHSPLTILEGHLRATAFGLAGDKAPKNVEAIVGLRQGKEYNVHLFRVFTDSHGNFGDAASIVLDEGKHIPDVERQAIARKLNTGETIFVNDLAAAKISVVHPQGEIGFAGVGVLGAAWLLAKLRGKPTDTLHGRDGAITIWQDGNLTWARASLSIMPPWHHKQLESPEAVERLTLKKTKAWEHTMVWAWIDEAKGLIRARTFASDWEIPEAQGNGSGSMMLAAMLKRNVEIKHGEGSVIFAKPAPSNCADIGGRVIEAGEKPL